MGPVTCIAVYLTIWWTTLFAVLPLGNRTFKEMGICLLYTSDAADE